MPSSIQLDSQRNPLFTFTAIEFWCWRSCAMVIWSVCGEALAGSQLQALTSARLLSLPFFRKKLLSTRLPFLPPYIMNLSQPLMCAQQVDLCQL